MPKVSVCIPTYNTERYLPAAIESVLQQEFTDYELIISDNASTDSTPEICARYKDPRIRYHRYEELVGQGGNWNRCVSLATGEYVALLHSDDVYYPNFLTERVQTLDANPHVGLAWGAVQLIDTEGNNTKVQSFSDETIIKPAPEFLGELLMGCIVSPVSPVVRRDAYAAVGQFNEKRLWGIDWDMWLRLAGRFGVAYSPNITAAYRQHGTSGTSGGLLAAKNGPEDLEVLDLAFKAIETTPELAPFRRSRRKAYRSLALRTLYAAGYNAEVGNRRGVKENLRWVLRTDATLMSRPTFWALWLSCLAGPGVYRSFRRVRPM